MLGTLAGISLTFISMRPGAQMWGALWIALPVFMIIIAGFIAGRAAARATSRSAWPRCCVGSRDRLDRRLHGARRGHRRGEVDRRRHPVAEHRPAAATAWSGISPLLATAIPLGIYNFTEAMSNVESAAAAGDNYNLRHVLLADGTGAVVGAALGSPFPPAVYIGQPGWKAAGGRISYSLATGVLIFAAVRVRAVPAARRRCCRSRRSSRSCCSSAWSIGSQAFVAVPKAHYAAVVLAAIPSLAAVGLGHGPRRAAGRGHERARRSASTRWPTAACSTAGWRRSARARCSWA